MKQLQQVKEWHIKFDVPVVNSPRINPLRVQLRQNILEEEVKELREATENLDLVKTADGICDCLYVLLGTALEYGLHERLESLFDEVHRSNMSKLDEDGNPVRREDGKILKSSLFTPPDLAPILS